MHYLQSPASSLRGISGACAAVRFAVRCRRVDAVRPGEAVGPSVRPLTLLAPTCAEASQLSHTRAAANLSNLRAAPALSSFPPPSSSLADFSSSLFCLLFSLSSLSSPPLSFPSPVSPLSPLFPPSANRTSFLVAPFLSPSHRFKKHLFAFACY